MNRARLLYPTYGMRQRALWGGGRVSPEDGRGLPPAKARRAQRRREKQDFRNEQIGEVK